MLELTLFNRDQWLDLAALTEAAWTRRALAGERLPTGSAGQRTHRLVCRRSLDLHTGTSGAYRTRHGNLRRERADAVLERALDHGPVSEEEIYFGAGRASPRTLADRYGDCEGAKLYFKPVSLRYRWLDQARNETA